MLELENIAVTRGDFTLLAQMTVPAGITAVIGPSGGGKSTLLDVVSGFLAPDRGRILIDGEDVTAEPPGARPVAILFQDNNLFPHLSALANVVLGLTTSGRPTRAERDAARSVLADVGLSGLEDRTPADLSGGQRARVAIARTILSKRRVLCLDEPFSALGPALRDEMLDLIARHFGDRPTLMVSHDPDDARRIAPRTIFVAGGRAAPPAETAALFEDPPPALSAYLG